MLAVCKVQEGEGGIAVEERDPRDPGPGEIMIKVAVAGYIMSFQQMAVMRFAVLL